MTFWERTNSWVFGRFGDRVEVFCYLCYVIGFNKRFFLCLIGLLATLTMVAGVPDPIVTEYPNGFRPDLVVHLYPEGQRTDRGIIEYEISEDQSVKYNTKSVTRANQPGGERGDNRGWKRGGDRLGFSRGIQINNGSRAKDKKMTAQPVQVTLGPGAANRTDTTEFYWPRDGSLNAVGDSARIVIYFPRQTEPAESGPAKTGSTGPAESTPTGQMILICPGGGYNELMFRSEGTYAAQALTARGYTVGIICYRMPTGNGEIPLTDVQNAFRYCRHHAKEWGISQIGIMGMSAGGHLAAMASTRYLDAATRPDFTILFYPVISADPGLIHIGSFRRLTGLSPSQIREASEELGRIGIAPHTPAGASAAEATHTPAGASATEPTTLKPTTPEQTPAADTPAGALLRYAPDRHITPDTPPALLFHSINDGVNPENSLRYYQRLTSQGVKAELHIFPSGGHGWGFNTLETAGHDRLEPYRTVFYDALTGFLEGLRKTGTTPKTPATP